MILMEMCSPQIWICLFMFRPFASKQLNSLITIVTLSRLGCAEVTHLFSYYLVFEPRG